MSFSHIKPIQKELFLMVRKYVLSVEKLDTGEDPSFVYVSSDLSDVRDYIRRKYHGAERVDVGKDELFKEHVIDKYYYRLKRTAWLHTRMILRIMCVNLNDD